MASHTGHRQRMKAEFLARGIEGWPDHRVLELLLFYSIPQGDVNGLAHDLIEQFGSLSGVLDASVEELRKVKGVGEHTAVLLRMLPALLGRYQASRTRLSDIINSADDAYPWLEPYFFGARNEMVYVRSVPGRQAPGAGRAEGGRGQHRNGRDERPAHCRGGHGPAGRPSLCGPQPREQPGHPIPGRLADHRYPAGHSGSHRH